VLGDRADRADTRIDARSANAFARHGQSHVARLDCGPQSPAAQGPEDWIMPRRFHSGFTLVELLTILVLVVLIVIGAVPSFGEMIERSRLRAMVERLRADVTVGRAEALRRNRTVVLSFRRSDDGGEWCYGLTLARSCDCRIAAGPEACELDAGVSTRVAGTRGIRSTSPPFALSGGRLVIPGARPTLTAGSARFASAHGAAEVRVAASGRVRLCSPAGELRLDSLDPC
jgi:type IV fimbrial biogenesis protein FimT